MPRKKNSALSLIHLMWLVLSTLPDLNVTSFLWSQICHVPMTNKNFHSNPIILDLISFWQFISSHFRKGSLKESLRHWGNFRSCQNLCATSQLLSKCSIVSLPLWHKLHIGSIFKPLEPSTSLVGTLLCKHIHKKKNWIFGGATTFQTQAIGFVTRFKGFKFLANM